VQEDRRAVIGEARAAVAQPDMIMNALIDAVPDAAAVLDPHGVIVAVNRAWRMFALDNGGHPEHTGVGVDYLDVCARAAAAGCTEAQDARTALSAVLARRTVERSLDYLSSGPRATRWYMARFTPVDHPGLGALVSHADITRRTNLGQDPTTADHGVLPSRLHGREQLGHWLEATRAARREATPPETVGVIYVNLEGVAAVGDVLGLAGRDEILQTVAWRLAAVTRAQDATARLGEHDFAVAAPGLTASGLAGLVARIRHALSEPLVVHGQAVELGAHVGACLAAADEELTDCLRRADESGYPIRRPRRPPVRPVGAGGVPLPVQRQDPAPSADVEPGATPAAAAGPPTGGAGGGEDPGGLAAGLGQFTAELEQRLARRTAELQVSVGELAGARKELEDFTRNVSHDLRAPLRAMSGFARILVEDHGAGLDPQAQDYLERIQASATEMGRQIDGLLALSRLQRCRLSRAQLDMTDLVRRVWQQVSPSDRTVRLIVGSLPAVTADRDLVATLLVTLLENAVKFSAAVDEPVIGVSAESGGSVVAFAIQDNGIGFDMRSADRLFRPFQLLHPPNEYPGLGLGLAMARQIVTRHGGTIDASAAPGTGARFRFTLDPPMVPITATGPDT
jgi:diguanylate cyclase (GGDEF)-like protein